MLVTQQWALWHLDQSGGLVGLTRPQGWPPYTRPTRGVAECAVEVPPGPGQRALSSVGKRGHCHGASAAPALGVLAGDLDRDCPGHLP